MGSYLIAYHRSYRSSPRISGGPSEYTQGSACRSDFSAMAETSSEKASCNSLILDSRARLKASIKPMISSADAVRDISFIRRLLCVIVGIPLDQPISMNINEYQSISIDIFFFCRLRSSYTAALVECRSVPALVIGWSFLMKTYSPGADGSSMSSQAIGVAARWVCPWASQSAQHAHHEPACSGVCWYQRSGSM